MKKMKIFALLLAVMLLLSACGTAKNGSDVPTTTEQPKNFGNNAITDVLNYAYTDANEATAYMNTVVAVDEAGAPVLTNSVLQIYYWIEFYNFMNSYGSYASYFGLDYTKPLADQPSMEEDSSWEQTFLKYAIERYGQDYALMQEAYANGYVLSEDDQKQLDDISDPNGEFAASYTADGYTSADDYLQKTFGNGVNVEAYQTYLRQYYAAVDYAQELQTALTEDEVSAYYDANAESYEADGYLKQNNATVRHILIQPEGEKDETTNEWTQNQWETAESIANDVYADWQEDPTEEHFIALVTEKSVDTASVEDGGLYENFDPTSMVAEFSAWSVDPERQPGDTGIVKTQYGYHIMYYVGQGEGRAWYDKASSDLLTEKLADLCEKHPISVDYTLIKLFDLLTASVAAQQSTEPTTQAPQG